MKSTSSRLCAATLAAVLMLGTAATAFAQDRDGYRYRHRDNNWQAPAAALLGGLVIGGMIANSARPAPAYAYPAYPAPVYSANPHADWCAANTPGYNPYDNTHQGYYAGERVYCRSPYGG